MPNHTPEEGWSIKFDEKFVSKHDLGMESLNDDVSPKELKSFLASLLKEQLEEVKWLAGAAQYNLTVDEYLPLVKEWDGKNFDVPFDHGYARAKKDILSLLSVKS